MSSSGKRSRRSALILAAAGSVVAGLLATVPAATATAPATTPARATAISPPLARSGTATAPTLEAGRYVVLLEGASATRFDGDRRFAATRARRGNGFEARSERVKKYQAHLVAQHNQVASAVGAEVQRHYTLASNGFTADLTAKQAASLSRNRKVLLLTEDTAYRMDTWKSPRFLGLAGRDGMWKTWAGGFAKAGDGVVIGDLDSGIWPESASFAGTKLGPKPTGPWGLHSRGNTITMRKADGGTFTGFCEPGQKWTARDCNSKLVGARYYPEAFLASVPVKNRSPKEYLSTRDGNGHGTHTASTAAGNHGVDVTVEGRHFGRVSGMAPAAKIAAYKVCFDDDDPDSGDCFTSSTLAAVDDAILDGVDVINYSISGATDTVLDAVEFAFEGAAEAGIFVATSAGNSGPGESTVAHNSPWLTTVAASTHARFENTVVLGDGEKIKGASIADSAVPSTGLVASESVAVADADETAARLCAPDSLDATKAAGKIVVCARGVYDRVAKSAEVKRAGGIAMILANTEPGSLDADFHAVPTIHISDTESPKVYDYIDEAGDEASAAFELHDTTGDKPTPLPQMAPFSSRGPASASGSDLLKPDITAPGVSVLAAVAPPSNSRRNYDLYSGTSMASPHIAGLAAFMLGVRPMWTPMMVKSAMMTTAHDVVDAEGQLETDPFAQGAGQVDPTRFFRPGLVVTSDDEDWRGFLKGQGFAPQEWSDIPAIAASELNGPSIAQGQVAGTTTIRRTFTSLRAGTWDVTADVPGFTVETLPESLTFDAAGKSEPVTFTFTQDGADDLTWATGSVTLQGQRDEPTVRLPVALRPVSVSAPETVEGTGTEGSTPVTITAGFDGTVDVEPTGLAEATTERATVATGNQVTRDVTIGEKTDLARFDLDATNDAADMDLYVLQYNEAGTQLVAVAGQSATSSADESVDLVDPAPGKYQVVIDGFSAAPGESTIGYTFDTYLVDPSATLGNLAAEPNPVPVVRGVKTTFAATWSALKAGARYLGFFEYAGALAPTYLYVR